MGLALTADERAFAHWRFAAAYAAAVAPRSFEYSFDEALAAFESRAYIPRTEHVVVRRQPVAMAHKDALRAERESWRAVFLLRNMCL